MGNPSPSGFTAHADLFLVADLSYHSQLKASGDGERDSSLSPAILHSSYMIRRSGEHEIPTEEGKKRKRVEDVSCEKVQGLIGKKAQPPLFITLLISDGVDDGHATSNPTHILALV